MGGCAVVLGRGLGGLRAGRKDGEGSVGRRAAGPKLLWKERHGPLLTAIAWVVLIAAAPLSYTSTTRNRHVNPFDQQLLQRASRLVEER